jgi:hypothetical protein
MSAKFAVAFLLACFLGEWRESDGASTQAGRPGFWAGGGGGGRAGGRKKKLLLEKLFASFPSSSSSPRHVHTPNPARPPPHPTRGLLLHFSQP